MATLHSDLGGDAGAEVPAPAAQPDGLPSPPPPPTVAKLEQLLRAKDDTSRFVALALLKATLDNPDGDGEGDAGLTGPVLEALWEAVPVKFLDRLLRGASATTSSKDAAHMRDISVAVLHTFAVRVLPPERRGDARLVGRIPLLVAALVTSGARGPSQEAPKENSSTAPATPTTTLILQTLATLVSRPEGAAVFNDSARLPDRSPLTELAASEPLALDILLNAWAFGLWSAAAPDATEDTATSVLATINDALPSLVAAFAGTDGVTLLDFVAKLLRCATALQERETTATHHRHNLLPAPNPQWLRPVAGFLRRLAAHRPTAVARAASTHAAAALLRAYPEEAPALLFGPDRNSDKPGGTPFAFLFVSLLLVDIRATLPNLLALLNDRTAYAEAAARLAAAYDVLSAFVGYLMRVVGNDDDDDDDAEISLDLGPDHLLRLRTALADAMAVTAEHLRERWDAAEAGAAGLDPAAFRGPPPPPEERMGPPLPRTLAWDAADADATVRRDPLVLAALRALALWLREDDDGAAAQRRAAAGLADLLVDLYEGSTAAAWAAAIHTGPADFLDFRPPVLVALEGIVAGCRSDDDDDDADSDDDIRYDPDLADVDIAGERKFKVAADDESAVDALLRHNLWAVLTADLLDSLRQTSPLSAAAAADAARGTEIVRVLLPIVEAERPTTRSAWLDLVTHVAAWAGPDDGEEAADVIIAEFRVAVLQLVAALIAAAPPALLRQYRHSIGAVLGLTRRVRATTTGRAAIARGLLEALEDVESTLEVARR